MVKLVAVSTLLVSTSHALLNLLWGHCLICNSFVFQTAFSGHEQSRNSGRDRERGKKRIPNILKWIIRVERAVTDSTKSL